MILLLFSRQQGVNVYRCFLSMPVLILVTMGKHEMGTFTKLKLGLLEFSWLIYQPSSDVFELSISQFV